MSEQQFANFEAARTSGVTHTLSWTNFEPVGQPAGSQLNAILCVSASEGNCFTSHRRHRHHHHLRHRFCVPGKNASLELRLFTARVENLGGQWIVSGRWPLLLALTPVRGPKNEQPVSVAAARKAHLFAPAHCRAVLSRN